MAGMLRVPRSRGALSGVLLVLLGAWGAVIPFIGPYFHYAYTPDSAWSYTTGRLWLEILPGAATLLGGLIVLAAASRPAALFGAWLAAMSGVWYVVGMPLSTVWTAGAVPAAGSPVGGTLTRAVEQVGFFDGLGAAIIFFAALALGRFTVLGHREAVAAQEAAMADQATADQAMADRAAADRTAAGRTEPAAGDRAAADRTAADRPVAAQAPTDQVTGDRAATDRAAADRTAADRPVAAQAPTDQVTGDRAATDRTATDRTAADRAAFLRMAANRAGAEQATTGQAATPPAGTAGTPASDPAPGPRTAP